MPKQIDELDQRLPKSRSLDMRPQPIDEVDNVPQPPPSPSTPRKNWERQYRNFLTRRKPPSIPDEKKEASIRGGSLFKNVFGTPKASSSSSRKNGSSSDLDGTLRRGVDKGSPSSVRLRTSSGASLSSSSLVPRHEDFSIQSRFVSAPTYLQPAGDSNISLTSTPPSIKSLSLAGSDKKKAFTEFHNNPRTGVDSAAPFLGDDDMSVTRQGMFWNIANKNKIMKTVSHGSLFNLSPMERIQENVAIKNDHRILKAVHGTDNWQPGRRYLIAPAALSACRMPVINTLWGSSQMYNADEAAEDATKAAAPIVLGECLLSYAAPHQQETHFWSSAKLVLRQNYLLEYSSEVSGRGIPRGYAHLEKATCKEHPFFNDALELTFFGSPCAQSDLRILMIRLEKKEERQAWMKCLSRASVMDLSDLYRVDEQKIIGSGHYATIYKAERKFDKKPCALKVFEKDLFWKLVVKGKERADTLVRETSVQATLTAKCDQLDSFVRLQGYFETSDFVVLELELVGAEDLFCYMSSRKALPEKESARILKKVLLGLDGMNKAGVAHRDIKPANILISAKAVKLCDFGMATFVGVDGKLRGRCGTPGYVAPEIFKAGGHGGYENKVDIFSVGVTLYVLLCGYEPFYGETNDELIEANKAAKFEFPEDEWKNVSKDGRDLVEKMMSTKPEGRPTPSEALEHPWFQKSGVEIDPLKKNDSISLIQEPGTCTIS